MPAKLEAKLKKEYGAKSDIPYKIMNKMGLLHTNHKSPHTRALHRIMKEETRSK